MKKTSLAVLSAVSVIALLMSGCNAPSGTPAGSSGTAASSADANSAASENNIVPSTILTSNEDSIFDESSKYYLIQTDFDTIKLNDYSAERFPQLNDALKSYSDKALADQKKAVASLDEDPQARKSIQEGMHYYEERKLNTVRADKDVFSFVCTSSSFYGGPHPNTVQTGYTYETSTGKKIELTDVIKSKADLMKVVKDLLLENYSDAEFYDLDKSMNDYANNPDFELTWYMGPGGITIIFNPYDVTPYAYGALMVNIPFKSYPELFTDSYKAAEGSFVVPMTMFDSVWINVDSDGKPDKVSVTTSYDDQVDMYNSVTVSCGNKSFKQEEYFSSYMAKIIHTADNKDYVYVFVTGDNDMPYIMIFDITGCDVKYCGGIEAREPDRYLLDENGEAYTLSPSGESKSRTETYPIASPRAFYLAHRVDSLSTYQIMKQYKIGSDGIPFTDDAFGESMNEITLTTVADIKAKTVDIETNELKDDVTVKKGEKIKIFRTNGKDIVIFKKADGSYVGITYDPENKINGTPAEELFEFLYYAG